MWHRTDSEVFQEALRQADGDIKVDGEASFWRWSIRDLEREISRPDAYAMAACKPINHDNKNWVVMFMGDGGKKDELLTCRMASLSVPELQRLIEARAIAAMCKSPKVDASQPIRI
jgi:hypothetical protein